MDLKMSVACVTQREGERKLADVFAPSSELDRSSGCDQSDVASARACARSECSIQKHLVPGMES